MKQKYILSVDTMFSVVADSEEEALDMAFAALPLSDLEFMIESVENLEEDEE